MAKLSKKVVDALKAIQVSGRVSEAVGKPLLAQGLIEVNVQDVVDNNAAAKLTQLAIDGINAGSPTAASPAPTGGYEVMSGIVLPESKRGFGRTAGPPKYPFATMDVGQFIFIPNSQTPDAAKKLASVVSNANNKFRTATGQTETKTRTKRGDGNKAVLDDAGNKVKETVNVPVYKQDRKFSIRPVEKGKVYGAWTAPEDGAVIARSA